MLDECAIAHCCAARGLFGISDKKLHGFPLFPVHQIAQIAMFNSGGSLNHRPTLISGATAERQTARQRRDFAKSDEIRKELAECGIILEDSKDGSVRWKRK